MGMLWIKIAFGFTKFIPSWPWQLLQDRDCNEKCRIWKNGPQRCLWFSFLVALLKKMREVFVLQPVLRKNLSQIFKIHVFFPRINLGRRHGETGKKWQKYGKVIFFRGRGVVFENYHSGPPLSLKFVWWGGVRNFYGPFVLLLWCEWRGVRYGGAWR